MNEEQLEFRKLFWSPPRDHAAEALTRAARNTPGVWSYIPEVEPKAWDNEFGRIVTGLVCAMSDSSLEVRRSAADLLGQAFSTLKHSILAASRSMPPELEQAVPALIKATGDSDPEIRQHILAALKIAVRYNEPSPIVSSVVRNILNASQPVVIAEALALLREAGVDAASVAARALAELLSHTDDDIRLEACRILAWLGPDAQAAVPALVQVAAPNIDRVLRHEAVLALTEIDPGGTLVERALSDRLGWEQFLTLLRDVGAEVRPLRRALQNRSQAAGTGRSPPTPPGLEGIWHEFTSKQRELLTKMWKNRRPDGLPVKDLFPLLGWEDSPDPDKCLRVNLSNITKIMNAQNVPVPWERRDKRIYWPKRSR